MDTNFFVLIDMITLLFLKWDFLFPLHIREDLTIVSSEHFQLFGTKMNVWNYYTSVKYTVLEIHLRSVKYTAVTKIGKIFEQIVIPIQATQSNCSVNDCRCKQVTLKGF